MSTVPCPPRATVRLQLCRDFTLDHARATVPYHCALGISHFYLSPLLAARAGSTHGYDVIDPGRLDPHRGDLASLQKLVAELRAHGMGLILDIVPNHMAASVENPWWRDLLEWGRASRYQRHFDIDWESPDPELHGRVLLPTLGRPLAALLADSQVRLEPDDGDGRIHVAVGGQRFPLAASRYRHVLASDALANVAARFASASPGAGFERALKSLRECLHTRDGRAQVESCFDVRFSPTTAEGRERLEALLASQPYLLVPWQEAWQRINWRRFFDINDLVAIRPDRPEVFDDVHRLVLDLYAQGLIDGVRIDHIDGLIDPAGYCRHLRHALAEREAARPEDAPGGPAYLVVEKILSAGETLRPEWPVDGTTGYEFMDQVAAVLHDPAGTAPLDRLWRQVSSGESYEDLALSARRRMLVENFAADLDACVRALRDLALVSRVEVAGDDLRAALAELVVHFPVYRTYARPGTVDPLDAQVLANAALAARAAGNSDPSWLALLQDWLSGDPPADACREAALAIERFQRLTPPVAAKAIEDTTFYRYGRLLSRNEVGAEPDHLALSVNAFHAACARRASDTPDTLLATATHDHKRGEDARARLAVLSETPREWAAHVREWQALNAGVRSIIDDAPAPSPDDEATLYQSLVGAWPAMCGQPLDADALNPFAERMVQWQRKALREAKCRSSWTDSNEPYEAACEQFLRSCLSPDSVFVARMSTFVAGIAAAGALNGLAQALLRMTTPGVPDLYQGTELWDFSLVDPDNRSPVDYGVRQSALATGDPWPDLIAQWHDGRLKQHLISRVLSARRELPELFARGTYRALELHGARRAHVIAFTREHESRAAIVVVPRLSWALLGETRTPRVPPDCWGDTALELTDEWRDVIADRSRRFGGKALLTDILDPGPVALLIR
ncbi:MAG: malto-oligosyltrehalose synthase [Pseudomonadota bacterium]|nr:malto-oligosyltrehalose synthase [Pseudomonadota bacterium]